MSKLLWIQAVRQSWLSYIRRMNERVKPYRMELYLNQQIDMGMKLEEFAEIVFMEGFIAGEKHAGTFNVGSGTRKMNQHLN
jgi:hypothetical protein